MCYFREIDILKQLNKEQMARAPCRATDGVIEGDEFLF